jgi:hypothetical protein
MADRQRIQQAKRYYSRPLFPPAKYRWKTGRHSGPGPYKARDVAAVVGPPEPAVLNSLFKPDQHSPGKPGIYCQTIFQFVG